TRGRRARVSLQQAVFRERCRPCRRHRTCNMLRLPAPSLQPTISSRSCASNQQRSITQRHGGTEDKENATRPSSSKSFLRASAPLCEILSLPSLPSSAWERLSASSACRPAKRSFRCAGSQAELGNQERANQD